MFSKLKVFLKILFCSATFFATLTGCNLPLNEKPPEPVPRDSGLGDTTACLTTVPKVVENFSNGVARDAEISAMFDCMSTAVSTFEKSTQGRYEDRFTAKELTNFVRQYFLNPGTTIPDSARVEVFRIKQLFVGGSNEDITRVEMKNLIAVIESLKQITLGLNPYTKVYFLKWQLSESQTLQQQMDYFEAANLQVQKASKDLGGLIEKNGVAYHLDNIILLLREIAQLSSSQWAWVDKLEKTMPLVHKLKQTLAGGSDADVEPKEWTRFALLSGRGYIQYLRYYYFLGSAPAALNDAQLFYITRSADDLFLFLGDMVDGKDNKALTRQELLEILQSLSQFIPNLKISDNLLLQLMKVKVLLFGGELNKFVKSDFDYARSKLETFRTFSTQLLAYSNVYALTWNANALGDPQARAFFAQAEQNLVNVASGLGDSLETSYNLEDLIALAQEIDTLYPTQRGSNLVQMAHQYVPVLIAYKNILLSDRGSSIGDKQQSVSPDAVRIQLRKQWSIFLSFSAGLFSRYAYYHYFVSPLPSSDALTSAPFQSLVLDSVSWLEKLIAQKPAQPVSRISFDEFHNLWAQLVQAELLPKGVQISTWDGLTQTLTEKILNPPAARLAGQAPGGLTLTGLQTFRSEWALWSNNQNFLDQVYSGVPEAAGVPPTQILAALTAAPSTEGLAELKMIYQSPLALSTDSQGRLFFSLPAANYLKSTSERINLVRTAVRLVIRSYAADLNRITTYQGLTQSEFNLFFKDFIPVLGDLKVINPNAKGFADNRFRDANLFSPFANGNDLADFREISSLSLFLLSGIKLDSLVQASLAASCPVAQPTTDKSTWTVDYKCLVPFYSQQINQQFVSLPDFVKYKNSLNPDQFAELFLNLLKSSGYVPTADNQVHLSDLSLFPQVVQYVENVYQIYDINRDGVLSTSEAMKAYPIFKTTLQQVSHLNGDTLLKALFAWLLKNGKPPAPSEQFKFLAWAAAGESSWNLQADRAKLAQILGVIADATSHPNQNLFFHIMDSTGSDVF